ncbi:hypothetical protein IJE86_10490 [bacterium]|nr:hypothetical protein [bacterium]
MKKIIIFCILLTFGHFLFCLIKYYPEDKLELKTELNYSKLCRPNVNPKKIPIHMWTQDIMEGSVDDFDSAAKINHNLELISNVLKVPYLKDTYFLRSVKNNVYHAGGYGKEDDKLLFIGIMPDRYISCLYDKEGILLGTIVSKPEFPVRLFYNLDNEITEILDGRGY